MYFGGRNDDKLFITYNSLQNHVLNQFSNTYKIHKVNMLFYHTQVIMPVLKQNNVHMLFNHLSFA